MKRTITILFSALILLMQGKEAKASSLTIDIMARASANYIITINGVTYETYDDLSINQLAAGNHHVEIIKRVQQQDNRGRRGRSGQRGRARQVSRTRIVEQLVFDGFINIPARAKVFAALEFNNLVITEVIRKQRNPRGNNGHTQTPPPRISAMNPASFDALLMTLENESFDSGKLDMLRPVLAQNYFSSAQILDIMSLFSFDSKKLEVAKMGYAGTLDKQNYFVVNNGLTFSSNKRKLSKFIQQQGI